MFQDDTLYKLLTYLLTYLLGGVAEWLGRRSLTGGLSLICA